MSSHLTKTIASRFAPINEQLRHDLPNFSTGDTIRVDAQIKEGEKVRIQSFEGVVIKTQGQGITSSVTVRKASNGVFVERTFPLHSPIINQIQLVKRGKVRRSRIYYLRNLKGKAARIKEILPTRSKESVSTKKK